MRKITNVKFLSLEFDFEDTGKIDAEVFVEIENEGEVSVMTYRAELQDTSFSDFITEEDKTSIIIGTNNLGEYIQALRQLITLKVANDLGIGIADIDYIAPLPLSEKVEKLGTRTTATEDAILALMMGGI